MRVRPGRPYPLVVSHVDYEEWKWRRHSRKSGNPERLTRSYYLRFLDARLRGHDGNGPPKFSVTDY